MGHRRQKSGCQQVSVLGTETMSQKNLEAFTLGNPDSYEKALDEKKAKGEPLFKIGRTNDYLGGIVFKTQEEAVKYAKDHGYSYIPYKLTLPNGWEQDVDDSLEKADYFCLLTDAEITRIA